MAEKLISRAKKVVEEAAKSLEEVQAKLSELESEIKELREKGVDVSLAETLLERAKSHIDAGYFECAEDTLEEVERLIESLQQPPTT